MIEVISGWVHRHYAQAYISVLAIYTSTFLNINVFVGFGLIDLPTSICAYLSVTPSGILIS